MCLGIPGQVIAEPEETTDLATVLVSGAERRVNMTLVQPEGIAPGDWVVVHAGFALSKLSEKEAREALHLLQELSTAYAGSG